MSDGLLVATQTVLIGIGATFGLDPWTVFLKAAFRVPATNYAMVGRW